MCGYYRIFINLPLPAIVGLFFSVRLAEMYSPVSFQLTGPLLGGGDTCTHQGSWEWSRF